MIDSATYAERLLWSLPLCALLAIAALWGLSRRFGAARPLIPAAITGRSFSAIARSGLARSMPAERDRPPLTVTGTQLLGPGERLVAVAFAGEALLIGVSRGHAPVLLARTPAVGGLAAVPPPNIAR